MNPAETAQVVALVDTLDPYVRPLDAETMRLRVHAWHTLLADVPAEWAMRWLERAYRTPRTENMQAAHIRAAWLEERDRAEERERLTEPLAIGGDLDLPGMPAWVRPYIAHARAELDAGRPMPEPPGATLTAPRDEAEERRCRWWRNCPCDHDVCRDGWLDEEQPVVRHGQVVDGYMGVAACPTCQVGKRAAEEAREMEPEVQRHRRERRRR